MKILFIDTTQDWIHISLAEILSTNEYITNIKYEKIENCPKESSFRLVSEINLALETICWEKPDCIVCLSGPGSFTGIRISVSTTRNLSQLWKIPALGIDSLAAYSCHYAVMNSQPVFIAIDGKQNKHYFGLRENSKFSGSRDLDDESISNELKKFPKIKPIFVYSGKKPNCFPEDALKIEQTLPQSMHILNEYKETILKLQFNESNFNHITPNYIRGSYIETNKT